MNVRVTGAYVPAATGPGHARIDFEGALCSNVACLDALELRIEVKDSETLERVRGVVDRHFEADRDKRDI